MNLNTHISPRALTLSKAVLLYASTGLPSFATVHDVTDVGLNGTPDVRIMAGTPLGFTELREIFSDMALEISLIPECVLSQSAMHQIWWVPASKRTVFFSNVELANRKEKAKELTRSAVVPLPPLLFAVAHENWMVFALRHNRRPCLKAALYHAPFFNVYDSGLICAGSSCIPSSPASPPVDWENTFFNSAFTHLNGTDKTRHPCGDYAFWKAMLDGEYQKFPMQLLKPRKHTLAGLMGQIRASLVSGGQS